MTPIDPRFEPTLVLVAATLAYLLYHYGSRSRWLERWAQGASAEDSAARLIHARRLLGAFALGVLPALLSGVFLRGGPLSQGLAVPVLRPALIFLALVVVVVLPAVALSSRRPQAWPSYPQLRWSRWTGRRFLHNALSWAVYLFGYELFFRGFLTFSLAHHFGAPSGLAIVTALYVLVHLGQPAAEAFGCLPMGFVFGWSALESGSFLPAFVGHLTIALCSDLVAIRSNPSIAFGAAVPELARAPAGEGDRQSR